MATPWDRAAEGYLAEWVPRFVPYHLDLVRELRVLEGQRVLVVASGPGAEVLAVARAVGDRGRVRATDTSAEMVRVCKERVDAGGFGAIVDHGVGDAGDVNGETWDAIVCAFGLWQLEDRAAVVRAWQRGLAPNGKVGVLTWGPPDGEGPFAYLGRVVRELEPNHYVPSPHVHAAREAMHEMFAAGGLSMVRHTVVRHTLAFKSAEDFIRALREACTWRKLWEAIGDARMDRLAARFYEHVGGPDAPLSFESPATLAIAGQPGAEIELENRPSLRVPKP